MTTQYMILYILMNTALCLAQCLFSFFLLTPKWKKLPTFLIFFVPYTIAALSQKILTGINPTLLIIVAMGIFVVTSIVLFKEKIGFKILVICLNILINVAFFGVILSAFFEITGIDPNSISIYYVIIDCFLFLADFIVVLLIKSRKKQINLDGKSVAVFAALTLTQFITDFILMTIINSEVVYAQNKHFSLVGDTYVDMVYYIYILLAVFVVADIFVFYLLKKSYAARKAEEQLALAEYKNEVNLTYYRQLEQNQVETRKLYHDMGNIVEICKALAKDEKTKETEKSVIAGVEQKLSEIDRLYYCRNNLVNAVLSSKLDICKQKQIDATLQINLPENIGISESDLCRVLVNLLDNAMEAAEQCENPFVNITAGIDSEMFFFGTQNPKPEQKKPKKDGKNHGFGLKILNDIAKKYDGKMTGTTENGVASHMIMLKLQD